MGLARRGFLLNSVLSLASFGSVSPAMFAESEQPESSAADPGFVPTVGFAPPAQTETAAVRAMREDKLKYSSSKAVPEAFFVSGDIAIEMGHDGIVMANGPMTGKPLTRRFTNIWQETGDGWVQIARQATYVGIDGGAVYGHPDSTLKQ